MFIAPTAVSVRAGSLVKMPVKTVGARRMASHMATA